jgi:two-component system phosphate regulon sensor histidine kinase PhoR
VSSLQALTLLTVGGLALALLAVVIELRKARREVRRQGALRAEALAQKTVVGQRLAQDRLYLDGLGEATDDAILLLDQQRRVLWGNQAAWDMFADGRPAVGETFIALVRDYELNQAVTDAVTGNRALGRQAVLDGKTFRIWASPVAEAGVAVTIEDVTELQRLGRARRDFVANISHELRTPLANIDLAAQTLRQGIADPNLVDPTVARRMLDQIQVQVQTLSQLSQEMMELAQIESGQVLLKLLPIELEPAVRRSVTHLLPQAALKGQHLTLVVPSGLTGLADEEQLSRVIANLVHNAVKFTSDGGIISVQAESAGEDIEFVVTDSGPGIPREEQPRIFERFYRSDRARSKGGTGLGLAISKHIVEGHGGRLWVESELGQGAAFHFTIPKG